MPLADDRPLLTKQEAAALTRMSVRTISYWIRSEKIETVYTVTGKPLIVAASLWGVKLELRANRLRRSQPRRGPLIVLGT